MVNKIFCHIFFFCFIFLFILNCSPSVFTVNEDIIDDTSQNETTEQSEDESNTDGDIEDNEPAQNNDPDEPNNGDTTVVFEPVIVAFIGDQGLDEDAEAVLQMILDEGTDMVLHQGDFDYEDDPDEWDDQITDILGDDFPYFASIGNHDLTMWDDYQDKLEERLDRIDGANCTGDLGYMSSCTYKNIFFVLSGVGTLGDDDDHEDYIQSELEADDSIWRICTWHKNQTLMQVGSKSNSTGWGVYETCREQGAIIATAHYHGYSRTHLMSDFENQIISSTSSTLTLTKGESFAFVSGLAGKSIYSQDDDLANNEWWASVYTADQDATYGALFCVFFDNNREHEASCYFKNIDGDIIDEFDLVSQVNF